MNPRLTIILVNWNTKDLLQACLESLGPYVQPLALQLIVVDNHSTDGSAEWIERRFPHVALIRTGGNLGFGRGNNLAVRQARSAHILFLNPDTLVTLDALSRMLDHMAAHPDTGLLGCRICDPAGEVQELGLQWFPTPFRELLQLLCVAGNTYRRLPRWIPRHDPLTSGYVAKLYGACLLARRSMLDQIGLFDERFFMYCEDIDLCRRAVDAGWKVYYLSEAQIIHTGGGAGSQSGSGFTTLMKCESINKLMHKYYGIAGSSCYRLAVLIGAMARLVGVGILRMCSWEHRDIPGMKRKYLDMLRWSLYRARPVIRA